MTTALATEASHPLTHTTLPTEWTTLPGHNHGFVEYALAEGYSLTQIAKITKVHVTTLYQLTDPNSSCSLHTLDQLLKFYFYLRRKKYLASQSSVSLEKVVHNLAEAIVTQ